MNAPSNANTSGLEVVRLEAQSGGPSGSWFLINDPDDLAFWEEQGYPVRSLVTAASAQARIDAAEARADRLAKALEDISSGYANCDDFQDAQDIARAALQQETQP